MEKKSFDDLLNLNYYSLVKSDRTFLPWHEDSSPALFGIPFSYHTFADNACLWKIAIFSEFDLWWPLSTWPENDLYKSLKSCCHLSRHLPLVAKWCSYQGPKGVSEASYHHHHNLSFLELSKNRVYAETLLVSEYCTRWTNMWNIKCLSWSHLPCTSIRTNIDDQHAFK